MDFFARGNLFRTFHVPGDVLGEILPAVEAEPEENFLIEVAFQKIRVKKRDLLSGNKLRAVRIVEFQRLVSNEGQTDSLETGV